MQKDFIKNIIITTLPLIAYIIADTFFEDSIISVMIAVAISMIEFTVSFVIYKKADPFILFDLLLISIMGSVSILLKNPLFFKLKPALIEGIFFVFLIPLSISKKMLTGYLSRYLKNIKLDEEKIKLMQKNLLLMLPVFFIHIILIIISAVYFSKEVWSFVSTAFLYIIFGLIFAAMFIKKYFRFKSLKRKYEDSIIK